MLGHRRHECRFGREVSYENLDALNWEVHGVSRVSDNSHGGGGLKPMERVPGRVLWFMCSQGLWRLREELTLSILQ